MKILFTLIVGLFLSTVSFAQDKNEINYCEVLYGLKVIKKKLCKGQWVDGDGLGFKVRGDSWIHENGNKAGSLSGTWYYDNGQTAGPTYNGEYFHANGEYAGEVNRAWYYSNAQYAGINGGKWYRSDGSLYGVLENLTAGEQAEIAGRRVLDK